MDVAHAPHAFHGVLGGALGAAAVDRALECHLVALHRNLDLAGVHVVVPGQRVVRVLGYPLGGTLVPFGTAAVVGATPSRRLLVPVRRAPALVTVVAVGTLVAVVAVAGSSGQLDRVAHAAESGSGVAGAEHAAHAQAVAAPGRQVVPVRLPVGVAAGTPAAVVEAFVRVLPVDAVAAARIQPARAAGALPFQPVHAAAPFRTLVAEP